MGDIRIAKRGITVMFTIVTKDQFMKISKNKSDKDFCLIEKEDEKVYLISAFDYEATHGMRIEAMRFEIFIDGIRDFVEEISECRGRNCGGIYFIDENVIDEEQIRSDFLIFPQMDI